MMANYLLYINIIMYQNKYIQYEIIGRGNYGVVHLVSSKLDAKFYVAKKIVLTGLTQKQTESALQQSQLIKTLKHPHIVSYIQSFLQKNVLIIIMQYCEYGDLTLYIKLKKQQKKYFEQKIIMNWFLQMLFALEYLHQNKILHRDIKSSNIFISSNGTIKLADFGISKVLQSTTDSAHTLLGTPYYMSPEVCENKQYSFKSDIWSLGCVLYELCTLNYAFHANNLLGLVYKIVQGTIQEIPSIYSEELHSIVKRLLNKDEQKRPSIRQIMKMSIVKKYLNEFVDTKGKQKQKVYIKKTETHKKIFCEEDLPISKKDVKVQQTPKLLQKPKQNNKYNTSFDYTYNQDQLIKTQIEALPSKISQGEQSQINQVLDIYRKNLNRQDVQTPSLLHQKSNKKNEISNSPLLSKIEKLKQLCIQHLSQKTFNQLYTFIKQQRQKGRDDTQIQKEMTKMVGKANLKYCFQIQQIIFLQDEMNNKGKSS